jgi:AcrR family transcriptional regulator
MANGEAQSLRADAQRNHRSVLAAGLELLARDPTLSMQEIADASGLGRSTLYRHFSSREELLEAVFGEVIADARNTTAAVLAGRPEGEVERVIRELSAAILDLNFRYGPLLALREMSDEAFRASVDVESSPVGGFLAEARSRGEVRTDMPLSWLMAVMQTLAFEALAEVDEGALEREDAERLVADSLVSILIPA